MSDRCPLYFIHWHFIRETWKNNVFLTIQYLIKPVTFVYYKNINVYSTYCTYTIWPNVLEYEPHRIFKENWSNQIMNTKLCLVWTNYTFNSFVSLLATG